MRNTVRTIAFVAALAVATFAHADGFSVKRIPTKDAVAKYKVDVEFDVDGSHGKLSATTTETVTNIDKDGNFTVEQSQQTVSATFAGETLNAPTRKPIQMTFKPNGLVTLIAGELTDVNTYRMQNLSTIIDPGKALNVGDTWNGEIKEDKTLGTVACKGEYKLLAEEKIGDIDTLKIKATIQETEGVTPAINELTEWISKVDGSIVQAEAKWTNAPFPGVASPVTASVKMSKVVS